jgi:hypothetical protein
MRRGMCRCSWFEDYACNLSENSPDAWSSFKLQASRAKLTCKPALQNLIDGMFKASQNVNADLKVCTRMAFPCLLLDSRRPRSLLLIRTLPSRDATDSNITTVLAAPTVSGQSKLSLRVPVVLPELGPTMSWSGITIRLLTTESSLQQS